MKQELLKLIVESIDLKKLANGIMDEVIEKALEKVVKDSANTIDDSIMPLLWPLLEKEVKKVIEDKLDLSKILGVDEEVA